ncbi:unnamed protein product [Leuciscus chuanchicus]
MTGQKLNRTGSNTRLHDGTNELINNRVKMPFHHVKAGLLYTDNFLSTSLSETSEEQLANISTEELGEIREAFRVLDRDGNGFISKQELGMAMRSLGYMPSEVELAIIMQRLDMDVHSKKKNRQTCVRKSLICAFAMAFIISVMLIAANQMLRNGME